MRGVFLAIVLAVTGFAGLEVSSASAADKAVDIRRGDGTYVRMRHDWRYLRCPDAYSCYPLYGAYGPYGGRAYWTEFSAYVPEQYR
jgi:hypothetical protein